jgi:spermidine synthase
MPEPARVDPPSIPSPVLFGVFVLSGLSALLYQMIWQRALLTLYGSNVESVAMVVSAFMVGLGLGSLAGGRLSRSRRVPLVLLFAAAELGIGVYGLISLQLFRWVGELTVRAGTLQTGVLAFALVLCPTLLMGATLPLLVAHQVNTVRVVGKSVSWLYFVNTLGAGFGAFLAAFVVLGRFGQSGSTRLAAALNALAALIIFGCWLVGTKRSARARPGSASDTALIDSRTTCPALGASRTPGLPFLRVLTIAAASGFLALSWEIIWARLYNYASASRATAFGAMLGSYLIGLAVGALWSMRWQHLDARRSMRSLAWLVFAANAVAFLVVPCASWMVAWLPEHVFPAGGIDLVSWMWTLPLVMGASALQGTILPLLCHLAIPPDPQAGQRLSFVYLANIIGSGAGSLLTGFVLMEWLTLRSLSLFLLGGCLLLWVWVAGAHGSVAAAGPSGQRRIVMPFVLVTVIAVVGTPMFSGLWERLYYKHTYTNQRFPLTVESRHGVINVDSQNVVYGSGVYDGEIKTSLTTGDWHVRPYFLSAVHPNPRRILVIGMSAGSWTRIIASHPQVEHVDVVEISHAYLDVIAKYPPVRATLTDPKVAIHIDDGRRWLRRHPEARFDAVVMNTTHHWREFASSLLSREFLTLAKNHLARGGIVIWNCTSSPRAARTGLEVFPHTMMCLNNCIGSLDPLVVDKARWRHVLMAYRIDGQPLFDLESPGGRAELDGVLALCDREQAPPPDDFRGLRWWIVSRDRMQQLWASAVPITDDNLGHEYP